MTRGCVDNGVLYLSVCVQVDVLITEFCICLFVSACLCTGGCVDGSAAAAARGRRLSQECCCLSVHIISHATRDTFEV